MKERSRSEIKSDWEMKYRGMNATKEIFNIFISSAGVSCACDRVTEVIRVHVVANTGTSRGLLLLHL
jgi:hypothetical protein